MLCQWYYFNVLSPHMVIALSYLYLVAHPTCYCLHTTPCFLHPSSIPSFMFMAGVNHAWHPPPRVWQKRYIAWQKALVFNDDFCNYDMILRTSFLSKTGIKLDYDSGQMQRYNSKLPMPPWKEPTLAGFDNTKDIYHVQFEDELLGHDRLELYATDILDERYQWTNIKDVVDKQIHLMDHQKTDLLAALKQNGNCLIDLSVSTLTGKVHIDHSTCQNNSHVAISHALHSFVHIQMWIWPSCSPCCICVQPRMWMDKPLVHSSKKWWQHLLD